MGELWLVLLFILLALPRCRQPLACGRGLNTMAGEVFRMP